MVTVREVIGMRHRLLQSIRVVVLAVLLVAVVGCAGKPPLYRWGIYEELIYEPYANPGQSDPVNDAIRLSEDVARTDAEGLAVPPGVHAHLGFLYATQGDLGLARAHFERERALYPESAVFIDGLIERMK